MSAQVQSSTEVRVPVKSWLPAETYRALAKAAAQAGLPDVGSLLEKLAAESLQPVSRYNRMTAVRLERLVKFYERGDSIMAIARYLGVSDASVYKHIVKLNLKERYPR